MRADILYRVRAEATSPSGSQAEWWLPTSTPDYWTASKWAEFANATEPTHTSHGVTWDVTYWVYGVKG
jgi:hypothetical protein